MLDADSLRALGSTKPEADLRPPAGAQAPMGRRLTCELASRALPLTATNRAAAWRNYNDARRGYLSSNSGAPHLGNCVTDPLDYMPDDPKLIDATGPTSSHRSASRQDVRACNGE